MINTESPLPWGYDERKKQVTDCKGNTVMNQATPKPEAVFTYDMRAIVTAVNCHNDLLEALQGTVSLIKKLSSRRNDATTYQEFKTAEAAIAKALNQQQ